MQFKPPPRNFSIYFRVKETIIDLSHNDVKCGFDMLTTRSIIYDFDLYVRLAASSRLKATCICGVMILSPKLLYEMTRVEILLGPPLKS